MVTGDQEAWPIADFKIFMTSCDLPLNFKYTKYRASTVVVPQVIVPQVGIYWRVVWPKLSLF